MTIILNFVEKDRILLIATFFEKVLPKYHLAKCHHERRNEFLSKMAQLRKSSIYPIWLKLYSSIIFVFESDYYT